MAKNWINDNTPWKNDLFLDLPFWREVFTDPNTSQRADIHHTRNNTEKTNKLLEAINNKEQGVDISSLAEALQRPQAEVQSLINDLIRNQKNTQDILTHTGQQNQDNLQGISSQIAQGALEVKHTLESILGHDIPKDIPLHVLGRNLTGEGKQTIVALAAKGAIDPVKLAKVISPQFARYMKEGVSSQQAKKMQESIYLTLQALRNGTSGAHREYYKLVNDSDPSMRMVNQSNAKIYETIIQEQTSKYEQLANQLIPEDELALLDVAHYAKGKDLGELMAENVINPRVASRFAKNGVINGRYAKIMTNMFDVNNGRYKPLVEMDGLAGIGQWTKANALMQGELVNQGILGLSNQDRALMKQDKTNNFLDNIDKTIALGTEEFVQMRKQTHDDLLGINDNIQGGFQETNKNLGNIDKSIAGGFHTANTYLHSINENIFYGFEGTQKHLKNIHQELAEWHKEVGVSNQYLHYASEMLGSLDERMSFANEQLGSIDQGISFANEQLSDIAYYSHETVSLLHDTNDLLVHNNKLQIITNHQLNNIEQQIVYSRAHLTHVLQAMTGALVGELRDINNVMRGMGQLQYLQVQQNIQVIQELQKQSHSLENIDQKLLKPNEIRANEFYKTGLHWFNAKEFPDAINDFNAAIQQKSTHTYAQYGLAIAYYHAGDVSNAIKHFNKTISLTIQSQDFALLSQVYVWLAKIAIKNLNIQDAIAQLEEAIACDTQNIDAHTLKLQLEQLQKQYSKVKISAHVLFEQLFAKDKDIVWYGLVDIDLTPFDKKIKKIIDKAIQDQDTKRLIQILQRLQTCKYNKYQKILIQRFFDRSPSILVQYNIYIDNHIYSHHDAQTIATKTLNSIHHADKLYQVAYLLRNVLPIDQIVALVQKGLRHDSTWTQYTSERDSAKKQQYKNTIIQQRSNLGHDSSQFIRNVLTYNRIFDV